MFSVGDRVKIKDKPTGCYDLQAFKNDSDSDGLEGFITDIHDEIIYVKNGRYDCWNFREQDLELINNKKVMTNVKEKFVALFIKEPEKTFRKAGITNGDGFLTSEGQEVFLGYLLNKYGDDFKSQVVDEIVKEEKSNDCRTKN